MFRGRRLLLLTATSVALGGGAFVGWNYITPDYNGALDRDAVRAAVQQQKKPITAAAVSPVDIEDFRKATNVPTRDEQWNQLKQMEQYSKDGDFDMIIIGGGATGTGAAIDAVSRGYRVALFERNDFASGTSSRATKMAHGGVRYLEKAVMNFDWHEMYFVYECLHDRKHFFQIAPHLTYALPILTPCYTWFDSAKMFVGLRLYDILQGTSARIGPSQWLSTSRTQALTPLLYTKGLKGSMLYYDGVFNDSRLAVSMAVTAAGMGASVLNHCEVQYLLKNEKTGKIEGVVVRNRLNGETVRVMGKAVINATGVWTDAVRKMDDPNSAPIARPSAGVHIVVDKKFAPHEAGILVPKTSDGRVLFVVPWEGRSIMGTTDMPTTLTETPRPREEDINFILKEMQGYVSEKLERKDVLSSWAGIRPLVVSPEQKTAIEGTAAVPREHLLYVTPSNLVTITGGKWTSFSSMAYQTVDKAVEVAGLPRRQSQNETTPLVGAQYWEEVTKTNAMKFFNSVLDEETKKHLLHSYGDRAIVVALLALRQPQLARRLSDKFPHIEAEVLYQIHNEFAVKASDVIAYRSNLMFLDREEARKAVPRVVELMRKELGWSDEEAQKQEKDAIEYINTCTK